MNILTEKLPEHINVSGTPVKIHTDFRLYIKAMGLLGAGNRSQLAEVLDMLIAEPEKVNKANINECITALMEFIEHSKVKTEGTGKSATKCFDFEYDAERIYAAFLQQYNIDLSVCDMHWWMFKALFDGLSEETQLVKVMQYRAMDLTKIKDKEQKEFYRKKKEYYKIPLPEHIAKKRNEIAEILANGGNISEFLRSE